MTGGSDGKVVCLDKKLDTKTQHIIDVKRPVSCFRAELSSRNFLVFSIFQVKSLYVRVAADGTLRLLIGTDSQVRHLILFRVNSSKSGRERKSALHVFR